MATERPLRPRYKRSYVVHSVLDIVSPEVDLPKSLRGGGRLVSVIVPTYEDSEYLPDALESIAAQTHDNIEVVVVDSSGVDWLRDLATTVDGVEYVYQKPGGISAARNAGLDAARGDVIAFLDADDRWSPEKLERQLTALGDDADVAYSDIYIVEDGRTRYQSSLPVRDPERHQLDFMFEGGVPTSTVVARSACFDDERFDESLSTAEDRHMWARLFAHYRPTRIAEPLAYYTVREASLTSDITAMYECELAGLADLAERYPEVAAEYSALERKAKYKHGKRLLRSGRGADAREPLREAITAGMTDPRALAALAIAYAPGGHARLLRLLERAQEQLR